MVLVTKLRKKTKKYLGDAEESYLGQAKLLLWVSFYWVVIPSVDSQQILLFLSCCIFWPAFRCCAHPKAGRNTFEGPFSTFFVLFKGFSVIFIWNQEKNFLKVWKNCVLSYSLKKVFRPAFGCVQHPKAGQNTQHSPLRFLKPNNLILNIWECIWDLYQCNSFYYDSIFCLY